MHSLYAMLCALSFATAALSQQAPPAHQHDMGAMPGMDHSAMHHDSLNRAAQFLMNQSSGTAIQAEAWPMPMIMTKLGSWRLMWMGEAFIVETQQSGPRGGDKLYSPNWGMLGAVHQVGRGSIMLRSMVSLDPATVTDRRYPLLFQTGENAFGKPIVDGQHPHDLVMELSIQYARPLSERGMLNVYYAPVGDPALGPVAYPHRASAMEIPQATLAHHWQDSTHIANNVLTAGVSWDKVRIEASGFHGREPNENRWNIDMGAMNSWSSRLSIFPSKTWMAQVSGGRLKNPEESHPDDVDRVTASVHHIVPRPQGNYWASSLIWGRNYKSVENRSVNALTAETVVPVSRRNFVTARFEWSQRDELFENNHDIAQQLEEHTGKTAFDVSAFTVGYTRDIDLVRNLQTGIGFNVSAYAIEAALKPYYGNTPVGVNVFLRFRLKPSH
ncbi:MAG: hypothetical protein ABI693_29965 [Bryobacteraceae bacterium]